MSLFDELLTRFQKPKLPPLPPKPDLSPMLTPIFDDPVLGRAYGNIQRIDPSLTRHIQEIGYGYMLDPLNNSYAEVRLARPKRVNFNPALSPISYGMGYTEADAAGRYQLPSASPLDELTTSRILAHEAQHVKDLHSPDVNKPPIYDFESRARITEDRLFDALYARIVGKR